MAVTFDGGHNLINYSRSSAWTPVSEKLSQFYLILLSWYLHFHFYSLDMDFTYIFHYIILILYVVV